MRPWYLSHNELNSVAFCLKYSLEDSNHRVEWTIQSMDQWCESVFMCAWVFSLIQLWTKLLRCVFVYCNEEVFPFQMISKSPYSKINYVWLTLPESQGYPYVHFTSIKTALVHVLLLSNFFPLLHSPFFIALEEHYIIASLK